MSSQIVEKEEYAWRSDLPNIVRLEMSPEYWIWRTENFKPSDVKKRFSGFISQIFYSIGSDKPITDIRELLKIFEKMLKRSSPDIRRTMLVIYWLFNSVIEPNGKMPDHEKVLAKHEKELEICHIEIMVGYLLLGIEFPWKLDECIQEYLKFQQTKFHKNSMTLPPGLEIALIAELANTALRDTSSIGTWNELVKAALLEAAGQKEIQVVLQTALVEQAIIDVRVLLGVKKQEQKIPEDA
jgi:hypothetical protein